MTAILFMVLVGTEPPRSFLNMPSTTNGRIPERLSETGAFADVKKLIPRNRLIPYEINVSFWSDGADKQRWIGVPDGSTIEFSSTGEWRFPAGTVFVKHFNFGRRRIETRLLVRSSDGGVYGASYRWRDDGSDAVRVTTSQRTVIDTEQDKRPWFFPSSEDCSKCHTPSVGVLGVNTRQLNRLGPTGDNQLTAWSRKGLFTNPIRPEAVVNLPRLPLLHDESASLTSRARSYLDVNCGFCHRPGGAAADFDARFETPLERQLLVEAPARINLGIDKARQVASNDPWRSMVLARMTMCGQTGMPPLAHESIDKDGVELLRRWIESLPGPPTLSPPSITPKSGDFSKSLSIEISHRDPGAVIRYTLDGAAPTENSPVYSGPIRLSTSKTVRARALKPGFTKSVVATETFIIAR
jgi:uncharacterized repeat protein (TIGR03806 family)